MPAQEATRRCRLPLGKSTSLRVHYLRGIPGIEPATWRPPGGDTGTLFFKVSLSLSLCHIPTAPSPLSIRITCITRSAEARKITARPTTAALSLRSRDACISRDEAVCGQSTEARKLGYTSLGGGSERRPSTVLGLRGTSAGMSPPAGKIRCRGTPIRCWRRPYIHACSGLRSCPSRRLDA